MLDTAAKSPTKYDTWVRDTANGELYPADMADRVGIGTATPVERLDVQNGNINLDTSSATSGQITQNGETVFHTYNGNIFIGDSCGNFTMSDDLYNIGIGNKNLKNNTSGETNIALGHFALQNNTIGVGNIAIGVETMLNNISGNANIAFGAGTLSSNSTGDGNTAVGASSAGKNTEGFSNTAIGFNALSENILGDGNTVIGAGAFMNNTDADSNVVIGISAGNANTDGDHNIFIGSNAAYNETGSNKLYIENSNADSAGALIFGNFATDELYINGSLDVDDTITSPWYRNQIITIPFGIFGAGALGDTTKYYFNYPNKVQSTINNASNRNIALDGTIIAINVNFKSSAATSAEEISLYIDINDNIYLIDTTGNSTVDKYFNNNSLNIAIKKGDKYEFYFYIPLMTTNPSAISGFGEMYIKLD
jgi:hypothetical protein